MGSSEKGKKSSKVVSVDIETERIESFAGGKSIPERCRLVLRDCLVKLLLGERLHVMKVDCSKQFWDAIKLCCLRNRLEYIETRRLAWLS